MTKKKVKSKSSPNLAVDSHSSTQDGDPSPPPSPNMYTSGSSLLSLSTSLLSPPPSSFNNNNTATSSVPSSSLSQSTTISSVMNGTTGVSTPSPSSKLKQLFFKSPKHQRERAVVSSPFAVEHITHIDFDINRHELQGLPDNWSSTLKRSASKLIKSRRDSTAIRNINNISNSKNRPPSEMSIMSMLEEVRTDKLNNNTDGTSGTITPLTTQDLSPSKENKSRLKSNPIPTSHQVPISKQYSRNSTPTLTTSGKRSSSSNSLTSSTLSNSNTGGSSAGDLKGMVIGSPIQWRREIHITWNQNTGQFEGVPEEWMPLVQRFTDEKKEKKRMEMRKRLLREEFLKYDKEEKKRRIVRDKRERSRLAKYERRKSIFTPKGEPIPTANIQTTTSSNNTSNILNNNNNNQQQQIKLWQISGVEMFKAKRVEPNFQILCKNDVFVLDVGTKIYVWMGSNSSLQKQVRGLSIANKIKYEAQVISEPITIEMLLENDPVSQGSAILLQFLQHLTANASLTIEDLPKYQVERDGVIDDKVLSETEMESTWLYRVSDNGKITAIEEKPLVPTSLNSNTCFILDCETDIFVWCGKASHPLQQRVAGIFAQEFLNIFSQRPAWASLHHVHQDEEPWFFKERFLYWLEEESIIDNTKRNTIRNGRQMAELRPSIFPIPIDSNFLASDLFAIPDFDHSETYLEDRGYVHVSLDIWGSQDNAWKKVTSEEFGHFITTQAYVVHHVYKVYEKYQSRSFFWQGSEASIRWWIVFQFGLYKELHEHMRLLNAGPPPTECLVQGKESASFLKLFNNRIIVHRGFFPQASQLTSPSSSFRGAPPSGGTTTATTAPVNISSLSPSSSILNLSTPTTNFLYHVSYRNQHIHATQFEGCQVSSLNSRDSFILYSPSIKTMFIWYGGGCQDEARSETPIITDSIFKYLRLQGVVPKSIEYSLVVSCEEGSEVSSFWKQFKLTTESSSLMFSNASLSGGISQSTSSSSQSLLNVMIQQQQKSPTTSIYPTHHHFKNKDREPARLYHVYYHPKLRSYVVAKVAPFCQGDLCEEDAFILDAHYTLFIWVGVNCSARKKEYAERLASQIIQQSTVGHSPKTPIVTVSLNNVSNTVREFGSYFDAWNTTLQTSMTTNSPFNNHAQSLVGVAADHRLLSSMLVQYVTPDEISYDSSDEESTVTSPLSSPIFTTPQGSPRNNSVLEGWEVELENEVEKIKRKGPSQRIRTISKLNELRNNQSSNSNSQSNNTNQTPNININYKPRNGSIDRMVQELELEKSNSPKISSPLAKGMITASSSSSSLSSLSTTTTDESAPTTRPQSLEQQSITIDVTKPPSSPALKRIRDENEDDVKMITFLSLDNSPLKKSIGDDSSPTISVSTKTTGSGLDVKRNRQGESPTTSPIMGRSPTKDRLLEVPNNNGGNSIPSTPTKNGARKTRGSSITSITKSPHKRLSIIHQNEFGSKGNFPGSIDAQSLKELKEWTVELELEVEVNKLEEELSKLGDSPEKENSVNKTITKAVIPPSNTIPVTTTILESPSPKKIEIFNFSKQPIKVQDELLAVEPKTAISFVVAEESDERKSINQPASPYKSNGTTTTQQQPSTSVSKKPAPPPRSASNMSGTAPPQLSSSNSIKDIISAHNALIASNTPPASPRTTTHGSPSQKGNNRGGLTRSDSSSASPVFTFQQPTSPDIKPLLVSSPVKKFSPLLTSTAPEHPQPKITYKVVVKKAPAKAPAKSPANTSPTVSSSSSTSSSVESSPSFSIKSNPFMVNQLQQQQQSIPPLNLHSSGSRVAKNVAINKPNNNINNTSTNNINNTNNNKSTNVKSPDTCNITTKRP